MGKKGKKGGKGGRKSKGKSNLSPAELFLSVRIKMLRQMTLDSKAENKDLIRDEEVLNAEYGEQEILRNNAIKKSIKGLYREDKQLEVTIVESAEAKLDKRKEIEMRVEKRIQDEINKKADLEKELERNAVLEATILKWTNYKNKDHEVDDSVIANLEGKVNKLNDDTETMKDFILNLIEKGKLESEELLSSTNLENRQKAFLEAMAACPPGALHECRESEELASWVEVQNKFVISESAGIEQLQKQNLALIDQLEELKLDRYNGAKAKTVLNPKFFRENRPNRLPQIPKIALTGTRPALTSADSYIRLTNRE